uniref:F-box/FBD/LRR-repeat protein At5g56810 isoform X4 n=1 Tax=Nicotiana tabacum TaxID=4097 RepID=A0A1S4B9G4_TOBAC|nr:PREDICTED: putative F-box/FBD/LRR-repeat protein At5g56810 isoform X4 [Nicotiana tabacum]
MALNDSERVDVEKDREDRISALPKNVIDGILELLPVEDAARTSILSKNWRYIWVMLPNLVLNKLFCNKLAARSQYVFKDNVDKILLQHSGDIVKSKLQKLLLSLPILEVLILSSSFLELLSAGTVPQGLPFTLNCLWHLKLGINFGQMGQISYALELIKSSHKLSELEIWVNATSDIVEAISEYLDTPGCLDQPLNKLKYVVIRFFKGSKTELLFVKLLFARCPSLISMSIKQVKASGSKGERNIVIELARYPRASPKAELLYVPRSD